MKTKLFFLAVCFFGIFLTAKGTGLEAREHSRSRVHVNVGSRCRPVRCQNVYVVRRYAAPQRVYIPVRQVVYEPVYIQPEPQPYITEEVYVRPARIARPSFFAGLSFNFNFR